MQRGHIYAFLHNKEHNKEVQVVSFTSVEINIHHFRHSMFNAQTYKQHINTHKQTQWYTHTPP